MSLLPGKIRVWPATDTMIAGRASGAVWAGPGWATGGRIARAAHVPDRGGLDVVLVLDQKTGATVRTLQLCAAPINGCGTVTGWLDADTVLTHAWHERHWLLAWQLGTGALTRVTAFSGGDVVVAVATGQ